MLDKIRTKKTHDLNETSFYDVQTPEQVKSLAQSDLLPLADSLREDIIRHTAVNGGHIGASLSCVDFIVALHRVFETPKDSFIFDVGHQAYAHKMLTGRRFGFDKIRKEGGPSGFTNRFESDHDVFGAGHASTSISAAVGILEGKRQSKSQQSVVAVIGDGSMTGGLSFEGFNHIGDLGSNLIVIFNDNKISIDPNVGALKDSINEDHQNAAKFFELLGLDYWGPFDGHNIDEMIETFTKAKAHNRPLVLHLNTIKGNGYQPALDDQVRFHGCGPFDRASGAAVKKADAKKKYQDAFAETLIEMANQDSEIVAITAAMPSGTSLKKFQNAHEDRFYDVGIAEGHAALFGAGLATQKTKPYVCIYSTFLQRAYDQLIHDIGLQNLPVRLVMDRAGLVGDDGATHQGVFDFAYMRSLPNFVVMAPKDEIELAHMMETMNEYQAGPISVRFPRGETNGLQMPEVRRAIPIGKSEVLYGDEAGDVLICGIGQPVNAAVEAAKTLEQEQGLSVTVINLRFAKPLDTELLTKLAPNFQAVVTVEEGVVAGGVGSAILELFSDRMIQMPVKRLGIPDRYIEHASQDRQKAACGIDRDGITQGALEIFNKATEGLDEVSLKSRMVKSGKALLR